MNISQNITAKGLKAAAISLLLTGGLFGQGGTVVENHVLPDISLRDFVNYYLPGSITNDVYKLGGIGSGLWHGPGDGAGIFWMITDRGPNPQDTSSPIRRAFPTPGFTPFILKVNADGGVITIQEAIPITGNAGAGVSGLPNDPTATNSPVSPFPLQDERPFSCVTDLAGKFTTTLNTAQNNFGGNHDGHDTEDLVRDVHGNFWTIEEYGPSITKIDASGRVVKRFVPKGRELVSGDHLTVVGNLPEILGRRPRNRGFEGLTITPDNKTLMAVVQSPLTNPTTGIGNPSRVIRLIAFDIEREAPTAEYVYVLQGVNEFTPSPVNPTEMKISSIAALDEHRFILDERTDLVAKIYRVDIRQATNILDSKWDLLAQDPSLESLAQFAAPSTTTDKLAANNVQSPSKELVLNLSLLRNPDGTPFATPQKIEGMTVLNGKTIAFSNDNDFGVTANCTDTIATKSRIFVVDLDQPIKK